MIARGIRCSAGEQGIVAEFALVVVFGSCMVQSVCVSRLTSFVYIVK